MIIEIPNSKWRIRGEGKQWALESPYENVKSGDATWRGQYFYGQLEYAVAKAYELALRESSATVDLADVPAECAKVADALLAAVRKAMS